MVCVSLLVGEETTSIVVNCAEETFLEIFE